MNDTSLETIAKRMEEMEGRLKYLEARDTPIVGDPYYASRVAPTIPLGLGGLVAYIPGYIVQPVGSTYYIRDILFGGSFQVYTSVAVVPHPTAARSYVSLSTSNYARATTDVGYYKILGTEGWVSTSVRGLSMGLWLYLNSFSSAANSSYFIFDKWEASSTNRSYALYIRTNASNQPYFTFAVYDTTNTPSLVDSSILTGTIANKWWFLGGRYKPSTSLDIYWGDVYTTGFNKASNTTSIATSLFDSTALLTLSARSDGANYTDLIFAHAFLSASLINEKYMGIMWEQDRLLFG